MPPRHRHREKAERQTCALNVPEGKDTNAPIPPPRKKRKRKINSLQAINTQLQLVSPIFKKKLIMIIILKKIIIAVAMKLSRFTYEWIFILKSVPLVVALWPSHFLPPYLMSLCVMCLNCSFYFSLSLLVSFWVCLKGFLIIPPLPPPPSPWGNIFLEIKIWIYVHPTGQKIAERDIAG